MTFRVFFISTLYSFFSYSSILGLFMPVPEIILQSD